MVPNDLKAQLAQTYELICFEDIANLIVNQQSLYQLLEKYHKEEYTPTQRLVFYSSYEPSQNTLNHIQRAISSVDIGNYFVLIASPFDIKSKVALAQSIFRQNDAPIESIVVDLTQSKIPMENIVSLDNICVFPFMQMYTDQFGNVSPCCKYEHIIGNLKTQTLDNVFRGDKMTELRNAFVAGIKPIECKTCWNSELANSTSLRIHGINKHINELDKDYFDKPELKILTASPSTACNFKCRICTPDVSSSIAVEEMKYTTNTSAVENLKKYINIKKSDYNDVILDNVISNLKNTEYLHIMGGEPFMWAGLEKVLNHAIHHDLAKNIKIEFNTNGSIYPIKIVNDLLKFKNVEILLSIDDIGERFELQRGGKWSEVLENIKSFIKLRSPNVIVKLIATVNIQNVLYLDQLVEFCQSMGIEIVWWYLEFPTHMSIDRVTQKTKNLAYEKYHNHDNAELRAIANRMKLSDPVSGKQFLDYMSTLDSRRDQSFQLAHKEIYDAMAD